jgi:hypothetical protein
MSSWEMAALADLAEVFNGKTPSKEEQRGAGHPVLKIKDVNEHGEFRGTFESFVEPRLAEMFAIKQVRDGDTLILNAAHNADYVGSKTYRAHPSTFGALATGEWLIIRPAAAKLHPGYLHHWVNSSFTRRAIRDMVKGIHLYPKDVARLRLALPPLPEQRRVAVILDKAAALRAKRRAALGQLDTLTQSIFLEMFGDPATNPKGWPVRTFDETMRDETARTEKLQRSDYLPEGRYPVVDQGQSVIAGYCDDDRYLCPSELPVVVFGDHTRAVKLVRNRFVVGADGAKVLAPEPGVDAVYLSYLMRELPIPDLGYSRHMREVKRLTFPIAPSAQQQKFAQRVVSIEMHCKAHDRSRLAIDSLFAVLQHRAFRGEL